MKGTENPGFWSIMTADVRYDKTLTANAKVLFTEITSLTGKDGYCWASNSYFAELYGVKVETISAWINSLVKAGHITSTMHYRKGTKAVSYRVLRVVMKDRNLPDFITDQTYSEKTEGGIPQNRNTYSEKTEGGIPQNRKDNKKVDKEESNSIGGGDKKSPPTQPIPPNPAIPLFSEFEEMAAAGLPEKKERSVLFHNSDIALLVTPIGDGNFDYKEFEAKFEGPEFEKIDLVYYYHKVSDWSARKNRKATNAGWLAWVREFIRGDMEKGNVKLKAEHQADHNKFDVDSYLRYMDKNSEY